MMFYLPSFCLKSKVYNLRIYDFYLFYECAVYNESTLITDAKEMACTDQEQMSEENKQIRRGRKKCVVNVNLLPNITGRGI
jgi:hypothetical protein